MEKDSALYQLMGIRMNGVMNSITNGDGECFRNGKSRQNGAN